MRVVKVRYINYGREYSFYTKLNLEVGAKYKITANGFTYGTPVIVTGYGKAPEGITLKEIEDAIEEVDE